jgi:uncharacterized membrane protein HdeD (DUF308 family)
MTEDTTALQKELFGDLQKNWGWLLAWGILSILLGVIGLGMTFALTLASVLFFGVLILVGGVIQFVEAFKCKGWKGFLWYMLIAVLYVIAGIAVIANPVAASMLFTLMLAGAILAIGIIRIIMAFQHRGTKGWGWLLFGGIVAVLLGAMIASRWPVSGLWVIGLFVAIELIMNGWTYVFVALAAKEVGKGVEAQAATA